MVEAGFHVPLARLATEATSGGFGQVMYHAFGFRHSIAASVEAFYLAANGQAGWGAMPAEFVVPSVIGNALGGCCWWHC